MKTSSKRALKKGCYRNQALARSHARVLNIIGPRMETTDDL